MATKTVLETLEAARKLITPIECWTKESFAKGVDGKPRGARDSEAVCWCSSGAICKVSETYPMALWGHPVLAAMGHQHVAGLATFNDTHTHAEVLRAFDAAIAKEKEAQHVL